MKESKLKHIDIVQSTINRMAQNSFVIKGWTITILVGLFVFIQKNDLRDNLLIYMTPVVFFWILDSYYLYQERLFREVYKKLIANLGEEADFSMDTSDYKGIRLFLDALFSVSELLTYIPLTALVFLLLCSGR